MELPKLIEALLFSRAEPWTTLELIKALGSSNTDVESAISELEVNLTNRGICLIRADDTVTLGTHPQAHEVLEKLYKDELERPLSKASIETLSIIMYGDEVTRGKIDYIRGVNSSFILRSLLVRGMIERKPYPRDRKRFMYVPTVALLAQMGVEKVEMLKDYERIHAEVTKSSIGAEEAGEDVTTPSE
jgi:segregation and condensation protein B